MVFTKSEFFSIFVILGVMGVFFGFNTRGSLRKARDEQRKSDLGSLTSAFYEFQKENGYFPESTDDGRIVACERELDDLGRPIFHPCEWYGEGFVNGMNTLLGDPRQGQGRSYFYISDTKHFQVFASLEGGHSESEYNSDVFGRNIMCGSYVCNYGKTDGRTPINMTLEEYEQQELEKSK